MTDLEKLALIQEYAKELNETYSANLYISDIYETERKIEIHNKYHMKPKYYLGYRFELNVVSEDYHLSNKRKGGTYSENKPEDYLLLNNDNTGRYSFINTGKDYNVIDEEWHEFRVELNKMSFCYDNCNSYWLFVPSPEIVDKITELIKNTADKVSAKLKEHRKQELRKELEELENDSI